MVSLSKWSFLLVSLGISVRRRTALIREYNDCNFYGGCNVNIAAFCGEMGMSWAPDEQQLYVGSVVLNRVASDRFPDTLEEVVYQPGQYACASYLYSLTPDARTIANARQLLEGGSVLPAGVVFQSEAPQGSGVYATYHDEVLGSTTYYCTLEG